MWTLGNEKDCDASSNFKKVTEEKTLPYIIQD